MHFEGVAPGFDRRQGGNNGAFARLIDGQLGSRAGIGTSTLGVESGAAWMTANVARSGIEVRLELRKVRCV